MLESCHGDRTTLKVVLDMYLFDQYLEYLKHDGSNVGLYSF